MIVSVDTELYSLQSIPTHLFSFEPTGQLRMTDKVALPPFHILEKRGTERPESAKTPDLQALVL